MAYSVFRQVLLIVACVAWIEFAIRYSPQIEQFAHNAIGLGLGPNIVQNPPSSTYGHEEEHSRLLHSLDRSIGKWDSSHPRHRLLTALYGFSHYRDASRSDLNRWKDLYKRVPKPQRLLLESAVDYPKKLTELDKLGDVNSKLANAIAEYGQRFYNITQTELDEFIKEVEGRHVDQTSVSQAMKHFVRDWAEEGHSERQQSIEFILSSLAREVRKEDAPLRVLVPGGGLGRLAHDIHKLGGFDVTMNEWSAYMNLAYRFVSGLSERESVSFHPYANWMSHQATNSDLERPVTFPDQIIDSSSVSHREGDFVTAFSDSTGQYDIVVTFFFIDTARNLVSYIETIHRLLRSGGRWINLGPLMYGTGPLVQLSLDEIVALSMRMGFEFRETDDIFGEITIPGFNVRGSEVTYGRNPRGLNKNAFQAQYWEAVKR